MAAAEKRKRGRPKRPPMSRRHGMSLLRRSVREQGLVRTVDSRTAAGRALMEWRRALLDDLGGEEALSTQRLALVDVATRTKLFIDSVDSWCLEQDSLLNKRRRALYPVVLERCRLADSLLRTLEAIGLDRRIAEKSLTPSEYAASGVGR